MPRGDGAALTSLLFRASPAVALAVAFAVTFRSTVP